MSSGGRTIHARLLCGAAAIALSLAGAARAQDATFNIPPQPLTSALNAFGVQSHHAVMFTTQLTGAKTSPGVSGATDTEVALNQVLAGSGLTYKKNGETYLIVAGESEGGNVVQELIVTAQKKEEAIQTVPIAISAFTQKSLEEQHIEGGFDLLKAIPNVTFSKNNFTSYNFSIRGIGTKAVSATTDPGVAVAFNDATLIQNRLFEQEYFDVERVEVLRGPQGTLYGRNATAGVINVISAKPNMDDFAGSVKAEVGNYDARRASAMINLPVIKDKLAIRFAGELTDRTGYDYNATTQHAVNGRDLWSGRVTVAFNPTERIRTSLVWEHFNEDDNRSRTGKQLCKNDPGPTMIGSAPVGDQTDPITAIYNRGSRFSQGCLPVSLYDPSAFGVPNGFALPFVSGLYLTAQFQNLGDSNKCSNVAALGDGSCRNVDPYAGQVQSHDLRVINSPRDPIYRAKADVVQFNEIFDLSPALTLTSQTTYDKDSVYSFQDYDRFSSKPVFTDTSNLFQRDDNGNEIPSRFQSLSPGGVYCDPQIGCSNTIAGFDISQAKSTQFLQEVRLQSDFSGPVNFSAGVNYTRFKTLVDYYVMFNLITELSQVPVFNQQANINLCNLGPGLSGWLGNILLDPPVPNGSPEGGCPYIDPNPVDHINGQGHNYFRSENPYKLQSSAAFGEVYWQESDTLKVTLGLRYTDDQKTFTPVPSQLLLGTFWLLGGDINRGYPTLPDIKQHWGEFTGRAGVDWKPKLSFTDQTMLYAFYSRGYKGGGANPPGIGYSKETLAQLLGIAPGTIPQYDVPALDPKAQNSTPTFRPEFVNAFEVGTKNTLLGGALMFNADAFFYDYKDYQVSKIVDRTAVNENFDAKIWGLEFETLFSPTRNLRLNANLGYLDTRIGAGAKSIDIMNRTQGNPNYALVKPWAQYPSNCVLPVSVVEAALLANNGKPGPLQEACGDFGLSIAVGSVLIDPNTGKKYTPDTYPQLNGGAGLSQNLEGDELPNSPHWTANIGAQYGYDFAQGWRATIRADGYWQSQSWARVYNAVNDKLHGWYNTNLSLWIERPDDGLKIEIYAKNLLDKTPITDAFINSDDTDLTTNVFVLDPRLIGFSITKTF